MRRMHSLRGAVMASTIATSSGSPVQQVAKVLLAWLDNYDESNPTPDQQRTTELSLYGVDYDLR